MDKAKVLNLRDDTLTCQYGDIGGKLTVENGAYETVVFEADIEFETPDPRKFKVFIYLALNACGLIGSECNGVGIMDEDSREVLCDEMEKQESGYCGASPEQVRLAKELVESDWHTFRMIINNSGRNRCEI